MAELQGFPYFEIEFTRDGAVGQVAQAQALLDGLSTGPVTDLFVISHGWNNDMAEARQLYDAFFGVVRARMAADAAKWVGRRIAVFGVLWPSKKFADVELIPTGAASLGNPINDASLLAQLDTLQAILAGTDLERSIGAAKSLVPFLEDDPQARDTFARIVRAALPLEAAEEEAIPEEFSSVSGEELLQRLGRRPGRSSWGDATAGGAAMVGAVSTGGTDGAAAGLGDLFTGIKAGARNLLNFVTYYQMKNRAGVVGRVGLNPVLQRVQERYPIVKLHLIGHSFGGRLVTAAAAVNGQPRLRIASMTLLQAAFSHFGFAKAYDGQHDGLFRPVAIDARVGGPILITCTRNDRAVGLAYPIASRIARQVAAFLGDKNDPYGGIGRNGAQKTPEATDGTLLPLGSSYTFAPGRIYNLNADAYIAGHSDICKGEVADAVLGAVATT